MELNLDEVLVELLGEDQLRAALDEANTVFLADLDANTSRHYQFRLDTGMTFTLQFDTTAIGYYLQDLYIGNLSGHFEAWFFGLDEFLKFQFDDVQFLLLLPMLAVEHTQIDRAVVEISARLAGIDVLKSHTQQIATSLVNALRMDQTFYIDAKYGRCHRQKHSVRNIQQDLEDLAHLAQLNQVLNQFNSA